MIFKYENTTFAIEEENGRYAAYEVESPDYFFCTGYEYFGNGDSVEGDDGEVWLIVNDKPTYGDSVEEIIQMIKGEI